MFLCCNLPKESVIFICKYKLGWKELPHKWNLNFEKFHIFKKIQDGEMSYPAPDFTLFYREKKSEIQIAFTFFEKWKVKNKFLSLFFESWKWNSNGSRSRTWSENKKKSREFSRNENIAGLWFIYQSRLLITDCSDYTSHGFISYWAYSYPKLTIIRNTGLDTFI